MVIADTNNQQALSSPTILSSGSSSATVVTSLRGAGLRIDGGREYGAYLLATYRVAGAGNTTGELTVTPASGATFVYALVGSGSRYSTRQLRVNRLPGSDQLQATATTGNVACGAIASGRPTHVVVAVDEASQTFDVLIDGAATPCTNLSTRLELPVTGFNLMDASNEGHGGRVEFGDLAVR